MQKKNKHHESRRMLAERVKTIVREHYEPGRHDRCKLWVYRNFVKPQIGISERTFWRCQDEDSSKNECKDDPRQMKLF